MVYKKFILLILLLIFSINKSNCQNVVYFANSVGTTQDEKIIRAFSAKDAFWNNGKQIIVCLPGTKSQMAESVYQEVYHQSVKEVQKFWLSIVFQGRAKSPHFFESEQEMIDYIKKTPGAVGVLPADKKSLIPPGLQI